MTSKVSRWEGIFGYETIQMKQVTNEAIISSHLLKLSIRIYGHGHLHNIPTFTCMVTLCMLKTYALCMLRTSEYTYYGK